MTTVSYKVRAPVFRPPKPIFLQTRQQQCHRHGHLISSGCSPIPFCLRLEADSHKLGINDESHTLERPASTTLMFSISFADRVKRARPVTARELDTWEQKQRQWGEEIQVRRRAERRRADRLAGLRTGYGPNGKVPPSTQARVSSLKTSPLAAPVFSPGRRSPTTSRSPTALRRRAQSAKMSERLLGTKVKAARCSDEIRRTPLSRPETARVRVSASTLARNAIVACSRNSAGRGESASGKRVRPASAPPRAPRRLRHGRSLGDQQRSLRPSTSARKERELLKKLADLSVLSRARAEFPTVTAARAAIAIEVLRAELCELRKKTARSLNTRANSCGPPERRSGAEMFSAFPGRSRTHPRWSVGMRRKSGVWDNRTSLCRGDVSKPLSARGLLRPTSAPALRLLTSADPVFGYPDACRNRRPSCSLSPSAADKVEILATTPDTAVHYTSGCAAGIEKVCAAPNADIALPAAIVKARSAVKERFQQVTIGALIELNRLPSPPKPVAAVLLALAGLVGWQRRAEFTSARPRWLFSNAYVLRDVLASVKPGHIRGRRLFDLERRLNAPDVARAIVRVASAAAAALLEWLLAVVACAHAEDEHRRVVERRATLITSKAHDLPERFGGQGQEVPEGSAT